MVGNRPKERGPSVTAALVASTLLVSARDPELSHLVDHATIPLVERAVREVIPALGSLLDHAPWSLLGRAARLADRIFSPGFIAHYALRKNAVRSHVEAALADGFEQVVLLGSGFDMLGDALPKTVRVFEVDHHATLEAKKRATLRPAKHITPVEVDLAEASVGAALRAMPRFDVRADTLYVAEGLLMYLLPERVDAIFAELAAAPARRTRLVVTVVTPDLRGQVRLHTQRRVVDLCMGGLDETFQWGATRKALPDFLSRRGFALRESATTREIAGRLRHRLPKETGEIILVAEDAVASVTDERIRAALAS